MEQTKTETTFGKLDQMVETMEQHLNLSYIESLPVALEFLFTHEKPEGSNDILLQQLEKLGESIALSDLSKEEIRKTIQLCVLKGMKGATQQQHLITPDTVAMFIGYLVQKLIDPKQTVRLFDPACGSANLLTAVVNQLKQKVESYGSDVDPTLIQLALMNANLQQSEIEFFHQDSLRSFLLEPVDLVVSDLPVGYYPDDVQAKEYELKADEGHSYAHHLFIEQSLKYTKEAGYLLFVIPNFLFESDQAKKLHGFLHKHAHIVGLLQLPMSIFKSESNAKSILILQKKGNNTKAPKQALMAQLPSFKDVRAMNNILEKINHWFQEEGF
ncbi:class I SAM-dependent methyltransferase [Aquibacillus koreensis]|uniref:Class I SAM-dependent methyltransferase n=1 Tax=Aquibacillus koreensis TaxID=279446 RepID=A0A9X4AH29_9BACI|nr:class I SAM-dependent methyltransferase [Aquibacillus koreensis]MCT2534987.1 class I SAM-dependent methyltransferase [Aquibacillus koreensis]MDC3419274.1 class I SAM-dependent methyltransferase [Aquibacillus koreensis]